MFSLFKLVQSTTEFYKKKCKGHRECPLCLPPPTAFTSVETGSEGKECGAGSMLLVEYLGLEQTFRTVLLPAPPRFKLKLQNNNRNTENEEVIYDTCQYYIRFKNGALRCNIGLDIPLKILILMDISKAFHDIDHRYYLGQEQLSGSCQHAVMQNPK